MELAAVQLTVPLIVSKTCPEDEKPTMRNG
jgi:hypothetical protein